METPRRSKPAIRAQFDRSSTVCSNFRQPLTSCSDPFAFPVCKPRLRWTSEHQVVLCVMDRWLQSEKPAEKQLLPWADMKRIFIAYFSDLSDPHNGLHQISENAVRSQLWEVKNDGDENEACRQVYLDTDFRDTYGNWAATRQDLLTTAKDLGINLVPKVSEDKMELLNSLGARSNRKKRAREADQPTVFNYKTKWMEETQDTSIILSDGMTDSNVLTPPDSECLAVSRHHISPRCTSRPAPETPSKKRKRQNKDCSPYHWGNTSPENSVFFRFHDDDSQGLNTANGFRAGTFADRDLEVPAVSVPDRQSREDFLTPVETHLRRLHVATPFISIWASLLPALHRGLRSNQNARVSLIHVYDILTSQPGQRPRMSWVPKVYDELKSRGMFEGMNYKGTSEWLVYDKIEGETVLTTFSISALRTYIEANPKLQQCLGIEDIEKAKTSVQYNRYIAGKSFPLSLATGKIIGRWLADIKLPRPYLNAVAGKIAWVWRWRNFENEQRRESYFHGVHSGYSAFFAESATTTARRSLDECAEGRHNTSVESSLDTFSIRRKRVEGILGRAGDTTPTKSQGQRCDSRMTSTVESKHALPVTKHVWTTLKLSNGVSVYEYQPVTPA